MKTAKVIAAVCGSYEEAEVYEAVRGALQALGGIGAFVSPGEHILVKPNFLYPAEAGKHITTHPAVLRAVLRLLQEAGCGDVLYGDSPASGSGRTAAEKLGLDPGNEYGARLAPMTERTELSFPEGKTAQSFPFTREAAEAEAIIGVCKLKTHMLMRMTGAVKNMFGLIAGMQKAKGHVAYPNAALFAQMLVDIHRATPQRLHIMDAVIAMEGNGPSSGTPTPVGLILVSSDPVAVDTTACRLIDLNPELVETNSHGRRGGIGTDREEEIELLLLEKGAAAAQPVSMEELVRRFGRPDFDVPRKKKSVNILSLLSSLARGRGERPEIEEALCVRCGMCVKHCPVEGPAVRFRNGEARPPVYDYRRCIRCFCCQEICPQHAIRVKGGEKRK